MEPDARACAGPLYQAYNDNRSVPLPCSTRGYNIWHLYGLLFWARSFVLHLRVPSGTAVDLHGHSGTPIADVIRRGGRSGLEDAVTSFPFG